MRGPHDPLEWVMRNAQHPTLIWDHMNKASITNAILKSLRELSGQHVEASVPLVRYGIDSVVFVEVAEAVGESLKLSIDPELFWEHDTVEAISAALLQDS